MQSSTDVRTAVIDPEDPIQLQPLESREPIATNLDEPVFDPDSNQSSDEIDNKDQSEQKSDSVD